MTYLDGQTSDAAADHRVHRHEYAEEHRRKIIEFVARDGVPYCLECHDWHFEREEHSGSGFGWNAPE